MRCPDCGKFVSYSGDEEPEVENQEIDEEGAVTCDVRIHKDCGECGTELKEGYLRLEEQLPPDMLAQHQGDEHLLVVEVERIEGTEDVETKDAKGKSLPARAWRTYYGASVLVYVHCACQEEEVAELELSDRMGAGEMEELT